MIEQLIALFDASVTAPVATRYGMAILGEDGPLVHAGGDQYTPIAVDNNAPWSYWRVGKIQSSPADIFTCDPGELSKATFRIVLLLPNDCGAQNILSAAGQAVGTTMNAAKELLGAVRVRVTRRDASVGGVASQENIKHVPLQWSLIALDIDVEILGTVGCLTGCEDGQSVLCSVINTSTNAQVVECLGSTRVAEICEGGGPCEDATVLINGTEVDTITSGGSLDIPVLQDGSPVGSLVGSEWIVPPCGASCDLDVVIIMNGVEVANITELDPCEDNEIIVN